MKRAIMLTVIIIIVLMVSSSIAMAAEKRLIYCGQFKGICSGKTNIFLLLQNEAGPTISLNFMNKRYRFNISVDVAKKGERSRQTKTIDQTYPVYVYKEKGKRYLQIIDFISSLNTDYIVELSIASDDKDFLSIVSDTIMIEKDYDPAAVPFEALLHSGKVPDIPRKMVVLSPCQKSLRP
ncbi:MAG: hypothetical protein HZB62_03310 [Nitrospirae bacterium]|nr:hypothetical protein [Nitrospirota bacterium]